VSPPATPSRSLPLASRRLPGSVAAALGATIVVGLIARSTGHRLGTGLAPFMASIDPRATLWVPLAVVAFAIGALLLGPRLLDLPRSPPAFAVVIFVLSLALRLVLGLARGGAGQWDAVFARSPEAPHEYLPALAALRIGVHAFLSRFAEIAPTLPTHPSGHPPGMLLTLHLLGITGPTGMAALTIGVGALAVPLTYVLGRSLLDDSRARIATLLVGFSPAVLIIGVSSADSLYATLALAAACALLASRPAFRLLGAPTLALASFFSPALLAIGAWSLLLRALRREWAAAIRLGLACALAFVVFYVLMRLLTGFDLIATIHAIDADYRRGVAGGRPYWFWLFGSPAAFLVALGIPVAWLALRALGRRDPVAVGLAVVIVISSVLGYTKAETERIWLFLVPLACLAAATEFPPRRLRLVLGVLSAQALLAELLLDTVW
jgi:hypothetical protein